MKKYILFFIVTIICVGGIQIEKAEAKCGSGAHDIGNGYCQYYNCGNVYDHNGNSPMGWPGCSGYGGCNPGSPSGYYWSGNYLVWTCTSWFQGVSVGRPTQCSYYVAPPVNGQCSSALWGCYAGSLGNQSGAYYGSSYYNTWTCSGSGGGGTASCSYLQPPVNGACGAADGKTHLGWPYPDKASSADPTTDSLSRCNLGNSYMVNLVAPTASSQKWTWNCNGVYGGSVSKQCVLNQQKDGLCGTTVNTCAYGAALDIGTADDTFTQFNWKCSGSTSYGGATVSCSKPNPNPDYCSNITGNQGSLPYGTTQNGLRCDCTNPAYIQDTTTGVCTICGTGKEMCLDGVCRLAGKCPVCSPMTLNAQISPSFVSTPTGMCTIKANPQNGIDTSCRSSITCRLDGALVATSTLLTGKKVNVGTHSLTCTDKLTTSTSTLKCKLSPGYGEF